MVISILLAINTLVFLMWNFGGSRLDSEFLFLNFLVSWNHLVDGRIWVLLTSVFSHSMFLHFFMNMYVLLGFGPIMVKTLGSRRFLGFYLSAGILSSLCHALISAFVLNEPEIPALGASGALSGLVLLFSMFYPTQKLLIMGIIPVPAVFGALILVGLDIWGLVAQAQGGGLPIGHGAHLGGALCGFLYFVYLKRTGRIRSNRAILSS